MFFEIWARSYYLHSEATGFYRFFRSIALHFLLELAVTSTGNCYAHSNYPFIRQSLRPRISWQPEAPQFSPTELKKSRKTRCGGRITKNYGNAQPELDVVRPQYSQKLAM